MQTIWGGGLGIDGFMRSGFTSGGQESESVFSAFVCIVQASEHYVESLPSVLKDKRSCFSQSERSVQLLLHHAFVLQKYVQDTKLTLN